jgi:hypothetical protein
MSAWLVLMMDSSAIRLARRSRITHQVLWAGRGRHGRGVACSRIRIGITRRTLSCHRLLIVLASVDRVTHD